MKWGGELTSIGRTQAEEVGNQFRGMYPDSSVTGKDARPLRLHSMYGHDLKIYANSEGRVQETASAFTKGFLSLEGPLTPIRVQMVATSDLFLEV